MTPVRVLFYNPGTAARFFVTLTAWGLYLQKQQPTVSPERIGFFDAVFTDW